MTDISEIRKLPIPDRLRLVGEIWESIVEAPELLAVSDEQLVELQNRLEAHRSSPGDSEPWEAVERAVFGDD